MIRRWRYLGGLALTAAAVVVATAGCSDEKSGEAARINVDGRAEVGAPGDELDDVTGGHAVRFGERVKVRDGTAVVDLRGDGTVSMRAGSYVELKSVEVDGERVVVVELLAGDAMVTAPGEPVRIGAAGTEGLVRGTARLSKGLSLTVGSYDGSVELASAGSTARIDGLRQMVVPAAGLFPAHPSPLQYVATDAWDRLVLGDAIELSNELLARSQGFSAQVPEGDADIDFFRALLPELVAEPAFEPSLLATPRPAGETLVGVAIVMEGTRGTFAERWRNVFAFRDEGAQWGLVALDQGVSRVPLLSEVDAAVGRGPAIFGVPAPDDPLDPGSDPAPATGSTRPGRPGSPGSGPTPPTPAPGAGTPAPTGPGQPAPQPEGPGPLNTGVPAVDDTANALVETLSGLLRALGLS